MPKIKLTITEGFVSINKVQLLGHSKISFEAVCRKQGFQAKYQGMEPKGFHITKTAFRKTETPNQVLAEPVTNPEKPKRNAKS